MNETHLPLNIKNSDSYCCYIIHEALKFIGEHNMRRILSSAYMICSKSTHTHTNKIFTFLQDLEM